MAYASFATIQEAWGNVEGDLTGIKSSSSIGPSPSDVEYSHCGAPIIDNIMDMYTPADVGKSVVAPVAPVAAKRWETSPIPSEDVSRKEKVVQARATKKDKPSMLPRRHGGDDYSDDDTHGDVTISNGRRVYNSRRHPPNTNIDAFNSSEVVELAAYVLSGVMLIFLFESFITIGTNIRMLQY